jgi:hypothetical protein
MIRFFLMPMILFSLSVYSCSSRKNKLDHRDLIPQKEFVSILTDLYITDGLLTIPRIHYLFNSLDSSSSYFHVIEKHGYTKETMDKTVKYYFIKNPKKLIKIYDQVLGVLSEMESIVEKEEILALDHKENLWTGEKCYYYPTLSGTSTSQFNITLNKPGIYSLEFSATLFPDDQSVNPRIKVYSCHSDSTETGKRKYLESINYIKDGQPHTYNFVLKVPENSSLRLAGCLFDSDNHPGELEKHAEFENISLNSN